jgi:MFS family permease
MMTTATVADREAVAGTIETRRSWLVAWSALGVLSISFGAPLITAVALKPIAAEFGNIRSVPALSYSLAWLGSAAGGIVMGLVAEQVGVRWTVIFGVLMIAAGLLLSSLGGPLDLYLGHGLFMGLLGNAGTNAPLYVYIARWFDRRVHRASFTREAIGRKPGAGGGRMTGPPPVKQGAWASQPDPIYFILSRSFVRS